MLSVQGECSEEHVCLPLFAFACKEDADRLEAIADEVLGTEEEGPPPRWDFLQPPLAPSIKSLLSHTGSKVCMRCCGLL